MRAGFEKVDAPRAQQRRLNDVKLACEEIAARFHTDLKGVPVVGDSLKDLQAAEQVGAQPILVLTGKGRKTQEAGELPKKTIVFENLADAARHLVQHP